MRYLYIYLLFLFSLLCPSLIGQVGINTTSPFSGSNLDVQNLVIDGATVPKGVLIPRMTQKQRDSIDVSSPEAVSLSVFNTDAGCFSYYSKSDKQWLNIYGSVGKAKVTSITCDDIEVFGMYTVGIPTNITNYLYVKGTVEQVGIVTIEARTKNGYSFSGQQLVTTPGEKTVMLYATGVPQKAQFDDVVFTGTGFPSEGLTCKSKVQVYQTAGEYSLNCANIFVQGSYFRGQALTADNKIKIDVNVTKPGSYYIYTELQNGIVFSKSGVFENIGVETVTLAGKGSPTVSLDFDVQINTNTQSGVNQCSATIPIILPAMTYAIIGDPSVNTSWATAIRQNALQSAANFSPTGTVKIKSFTKLWEANTIASAITYLNSGFGGKYPDVVLYYSSNLNATAALATAVSNYLSKGGCIIYGTFNTSNIAGSQLFLREIFPSLTNANIVRQVAGNTRDARSNDSYPINLYSNDTMINGPFGNLSNSAFWGEETTSTFSTVTTALPQGSVQVVPASNYDGKSSVDPAYSLVWYNEKSNFVYFGSSTGASAVSNDSVQSPALYINNIPQTKLYGNKDYTEKKFVDDAALELNAVYWCLREAVKNGINGL